MNEVLLSCGSICIILTYVFYILQIQKGDSIPNPATIFIWFVVGTMNAFSYREVVSGNLWKSLIFFVVASLQFLLFFYCLIRGKFVRPRAIEFIAILGAFFVGILWKTTGDPIVSNIFLQGIYLISFVPLIIGLIKKRTREKPLAWAFAVSAYVFVIIATTLKFDGNWISLISPIFVGIIGNGSVALLALFIRK